MNNLYLLIHTYEFCNETEIKILGIYSTKEKAREAKARFYQREGFNKYPERCFSVLKFSLDVDGDWCDGFVSSEEKRKQDRKRLGPC